MLFRSTVVAVVLLALMLFQIFRPTPDFQKKDQKKAAKLESAGEAKANA